LASAAEDAKRRLTLLEVWFQGADHPLPLAFREGRYLKVVLCRVEG
jgi:23S rRNA G2069 N7-methylase RlmK/C1962 C5-methylase RlmI